ncbi:MAG: OmpA family protein [Granulosicoccus sp.]
MQGTTDIKQRFSLNCRISLLFVMLLWTFEGMAQSHIDLLIIIDEDGIGYTAQQTLLANNELIVSRLPPNRTTLTTVFSGSGSAVYRRAYESDPNKLSLLSGSVFTRFRHQFGSRADTTDDQSRDLFDAPVIQATLDQYQITIGDTQSLTSRISWILPSNVELLGYYTNENNVQNSDSSWTQEGQVLTFEQVGGTPAQLTLEYRVHSSNHNRDLACLESLGPSEWCSPDVDRDGVPDYRDLCLPEDASATASSDKQDNILSDNKTGLPQAGVTPTRKRENSLGCEDDTLVVLPRIQFASGQTYLNAQARQTLDKVAIALGRLPDNLYRIAAHTDNAGYVQNNQTLSDSRAAAIRHYLMLRGLGPNQIQARGYGETSPAHDNRNAEGRRANRRVELQLIN